MTTEQIDAQIRGMVVRRVPREQIAAAVGMTVEAVNERVRHIWRVHHDRGKPTDDETPPPEEIAARAAAVRRRWTAQERERRCMKGGPR